MIKYEYKRACGAPRKDRPQNSGSVPVKRSFAHERPEAHDLFRGSAAAVPQRTGTAGHRRGAAGAGIQLLLHPGGAAEPEGLLFHAAAGTQQRHGGDRIVLHDQPQLSLCAVYSGTGHRGRLQLPERAVRRGGLRRHGTDGGAFRPAASGAERPVLHHHHRPAHEG